jgi:hypothetical protein
LVPAFERGNLLGIQGGAGALALALVQSGAMRRLWRWAFNGLAAVSLLLCVATSALWVRSFFCNDRFAREMFRWDAYGQTISQVGLGFGDGRAILFHRKDLGVPAADAALYKPVWSWSSGSASSLSMGDWRWWDYEFTKGQFYYEDWWIGCRLWPVAGMSAILPALWAWRRMTGRAAEVGRCGNCGYDLRATPERCPECGTASARARVSG